MAEGNLQTLAVVGTQVNAALIPGSLSFAAAREGLFKDSGFARKLTILISADFNSVVLFRIVSILGGDIPSQRGAVNLNLRADEIVVRIENTDVVIFD